MIKEILSEKIPIKMWVDNVEDSALNQIKNLANLPFAYKHIAIMPDCHTGYGMPIGAVLAAKDVILPNAVGVDIGCGMVALRTTLKDIDRQSIINILKGIRSYIPLGFEHHKRPQDERLMPYAGKAIFSKDKDYYIVKQEYISALRQLGTLGGGNHFIEIQKGSDGFIWIMLHSGSRNLGFKVANHYNRLAKDISDKLPYKIPKSYDLAYLMIDSREGVSYLREMNYCLEFAKANRALMLSLIKRVFNEITHCDFKNEINIHHNYAVQEEHFGENVFVHRKGATSAKINEFGIIPGSQGTPSYIVKGLGNPDSFRSCSHGSGRNMSRNEARKRLNLGQERAKLEVQGIIHSIRTKRDLDEASSAYKDIQAVMDNQLDLVKPEVKMIPLAVIKG
jgi:tRNA-splicing ligase RtcB